MTNDLPRVGRAALLHSFGAELQVVEVPVPRPEPGALVVRVEASTVCGSDVHMWKGAVNPIFPLVLPINLGHEIVGAVVAIGDGAEIDSVGNPIRVGDRVVWEHAACGRCEACTILHEPTLCPDRQVGMFRTATEFPYTAGGFTEYSYVWPRSGRLRVQDKVPSDIAAAGSCALRTVVSAFDRLGPIDFRSRVVVQGAGPLGLFATAMAAVHRPRQLVVVGAPDDRLELARCWGATDVVSVDEYPGSEERISKVVDITDGGPDVIVEVSGAPGAFGEGVLFARRSARYVVVGTLGGPDQAVNVARIVSRQLRIVGSLGSDIGAYDGAMRFLADFADEFDWSRMFTGKHYGLGECTEALESLEQMSEIKPVIVPNE